MKLLTNLLISLSSHFAFAAPYGMVYTHQVMETVAPETLVCSDRSGARTKLLYGGGPILSDIKIFAVFWGSNIDKSVQTGISPMLEATVNSTYWDMLKEYSTNINSSTGRPGTNQMLGRGSFVDQVTIKPKNTKTLIDDKEIGPELEYQILNGNLPKPDANTAYILFFPPGTTISLEGMLSCKYFCGYHHNFASANFGSIFYSVEPDVNGTCQFGCGVDNNPFNGFTSVVAHELTEIATDPATTMDLGLLPAEGWRTSRGEEVGDLCAAENTKLTTGDGTTYILQSAFDNATSACAPGPFYSR